MYFRCAADHEAAGNRTNGVIFAEHHPLGVVGLRRQRPQASPGTGPSGLGSTQPENVRDGYAEVEQTQVLRSAARLRPALRRSSARRFPVEVLLPHSLRARRCRRGRTRRSRWCFSPVLLDPGHRGSDIVIEPRDQRVCGDRCPAFVGVLEFTFRRHLLVLQGDQGWLRKSGASVESLGSGTCICA